MVKHKANNTIPKTKSRKTSRVSKTCKRENKEWYDKYLQQQQRKKLTKEEDFVKAIKEIEVQRKNKG